MELPINSTFLILLKVLGIITSEAKLNRIAAYNEGSIVGAAWKISLITAKFVDQTRQIPSTTPLHTADGCFFSASVGKFDSSILIVDSILAADLIPVDIGTGDDLKG